jgi:tRNA1Val (adenine37-N6)-methyltransferase
MGNDFFQFKQFRVLQSTCAMKVTTDSCLFGAWVANESKQANNILDIGAGTGLLGMMIAQKYNSKIHAIEIEPGCFKQLKENIENSKWIKNFNLHLGDIRELKPSSHFDLIISNPPFYENQLIAENKSVNLARHSNALSLIELFEAAERMLDQKGYFYVLLPSFRKEECIEVASSYRLYPTSIAQVKQTPSHTFFRTMLGFSREKNDNPTLKEISIKTNEGNYSDQFIELLSEYYLNL